jgi:hypothetical protein
LLLLRNFVIEVLTVPALHTFTFFYPTVLLFVRYSNAQQKTPPHGCGGVLAFKPQLACASGGLEVVADTSTKGGIRTFNFGCECCKFGTLAEKVLC